MKRIRNRVGNFVEHLEPRTMLTGAPELLLDINVEIDEPEFGALIPVGDSNYFLKGDELWVTNGTRESTRMVHDVSLASGRSLSHPAPRITQHLVSGEEFYFVREKKERLWESSNSVTRHWDELWVTDSTNEGAVRLKSGPGEIRDLVQVEDSLFFTNAIQTWVPAGWGSFEPRTTIWKTNVASGETVQVVPQFENVSAMVDYEGQLVFATDDAVWTLDNNNASSKLVDLRNVDSLTVIAADLYITTEQHRSRNEIVKLFNSDGTDSGTTEIFESRADSNEISSQVAVGNRFFFQTYSCSDSCKTQIWVSDGSEAGTSLVADNVDNRSMELSGESVVFTKDGAINVATVNAGDVGVVEFAGRPHTYAQLDPNFYFANETESGAELYVADLTTGESSVLLAELDKIQEIGFAVDTLLIVGEKGAEGGRLWTSSGADATALTDTSEKTQGSVGTVSCLIGGCDVDLSFVGVFDDFAYFYADDGRGTSLWKTDGTALGSEKVADEIVRHRLHNVEGQPTTSMRLGTTIFDSRQLPEDQNQTVVSALDFETGNTTRLLEIDGSVQMLGTVNDQIIFSSLGSEGGGIWRSDGTVDGTVAVGIADVSSSTPVALFAGDLYFVAQNEAHGKELWKSDGTIEGTTLVVDLLPGPGSAAPTELMVLNDTLLFTADDGEHGHELWSIRADERLPPKPDVILTSPEVGRIAAGSYQPLTDVDLKDYRRLFIEEGKFYFTVSVGGESQVWKTDGTPESTEYALTLPTNDFHGLGGYPRDNTSLVTNTHEFYIGNLSYELWANDGKSVYQVIDLEESENYISSLLIATNSHAFFGTRGRQGDQLWSTDGTDDGTQLIARTFVGPDSVVLLGDLVYFTVTDHDSSSTELWVSDGSEAGTFVVDELTGEAWNLTAVNGSLIVGRTSEIGRDVPWVYRPATLGDLDRDGDVDFADFLALSSNFGAEQAGREQGDINGDNSIDFSDFLLMAKYFGSHDSGQEVIDAVVDHFV